MPRHDYRCLRCHNVVEVTFSIHERLPESVPCTCGGAYFRVWLQAPAMHSDLSPYWDVQLGCQINSKQERDAILKRKGLVAVGPDEARWTSSQAHDQEPAFDSEKFREVCQDVWHKIETKEIPLQDAAPLPDYVTGDDSVIITQTEGS